MNLQTQKVSKVPQFDGTSNFVHHFIAIREFKLELQYRNAKGGQN